MNNRINVLDINIDKFTAKQAMKCFIEFMQTDPVDVIEMVTVENLMQMNETPDLKGSVRDFELILAGESMILESAGVTDKDYLLETEKQTFLKMLFRYLHKNHKRVYLLVDTQEEGQALYHYLEHHYRGVQIGGMAKVVDEDRADDMVVNAVNGADIDCVISTMSSPLQEDFILKNRSILNAHVWLGLGKEVLDLKKTGIMLGRFTQFITKKIFQKEVERRKRDVSNSMIQ
ncbi:MAG: WecB/TagA/CpsF family glycosyltransferase [Lachnospiraceae bacterium]